jgi:purine-nucleoside/S-methyl-5'-thioadenosine phosphorylase / adenosine deaminase
VFILRDTCGQIELAFTDRSIDLSTAAVDHTLSEVASAAEVDSLATMHQVHGSDVAWVDVAGTQPEADALLTDVVGLGLLVRVADCVPVVLAVPDEQLAGVVHCGRQGLVAGVVPVAIDALRRRGATRIEAWVGPRVCGRCYELPAAMAEAVAAAVPEAKSTTSWGTPAADIGAGVVAQLAARDVIVHDVGADLCTMEDERFFSHRREGEASGRFAAFAVLRAPHE